MKQPALTAIPQHIVSTHDYQQQARHHIDDNAWHYLIGGAGDEITVNANEHVIIVWPSLSASDFFSSCGLSNPVSSSRRTRHGFSSTRNEHALYRQ